MKHLKKYNEILLNCESFSMSRDKCDRCESSTDNKTTQSMFNEEVICMKCKEDEIKDPEYNAACVADQESYLSGNRNFGGVMPDYKSIIPNY